MAAEIVSLNPSEGINGYMLSCVNRGLCDGLITRSEESYHASNCMCLRSLNTEEGKAQISVVVA